MSHPQDIIDHLAALARAFPNMADPQSLNGFVLAFGRPFDGAKRPRHIKKRRNRECFKNATHLAMYDGFSYAEGFAIHRDLFPMHHAWNVAPDGTVVDVTWRYPEDSSYFGVVIPEYELRVETLRNKVYGVLAPNEMSNPKFFAKLREKGLLPASRAL